MLKNFNEMRKVNVLPYCEKREGMLYLNWAKCIDLLHENGAENVYFVPIPNERTGGSLYYSDVAFTDKNGVIKVILHLISGKPAGSMERYSNEIFSTGDFVRE